jgi:hypothetical protein
MQVTKGSCAYCDEKILQSIKSSEGNVMLHIDAPPHIEYYDDICEWQSEYFYIKFCPMCGRQLSGAE